MEARPRVGGFWSTQPIADAAPLAAEFAADAPTPLPAGLHWYALDVSHEAGLRELRDFLAAHYLDAAAGARLVYSAEMLQWALTPPAQRPDWIVGIRGGSSDSGGSAPLVATVTAAPLRVSIDGAAIDAVEVNFLCVARHLRGAGLAPLLITEITRRVGSATARRVALFTAQSLFTRPLAKAGFWLRPLEPARARAAGMLGPLGTRLTPSREARLLALPPPPPSLRLRPLDAALVPRARACLAAALASRAVHAVFDDDAEAAYWLLPRPGVVDTLVATTLVDGADMVTDVVSWTFLERKGGGGGGGGGGGRPDLVIASLFYCAASTAERGHDMLLQAMARAHAVGGAHVFQVLATGGAPRGIDWASLRFVAGTGGLYYYVFNHERGVAAPPLTADDVGLVFL